MNVFGSQNLFGHLIDPKMVIFRAFVFRYRFRVGLQQKKGGLFSDEIPIQKRHPDLVLHMSWEATSLVTSRKQQYSTVVEQDTSHTHQRRTRAAAAVSRYPLTHTSGLTTCRWDRTVMLTARVLPPSSKLRSHHSPRTENTLFNTRIYLSRTRTAAVCDMSLLMHEIDGSEGEDQPSSRDAHGLFFLASPTKLHLCVR